MITDRARRCIAEALGTSVLVALGPGSAMVAQKTQAFGHAGVALAFGLAVTIVVAATGQVSGAHINPAVTIGFWTRGRFAVRDVVPYLAAQCIGAIAAAFVLVWIVGAQSASASATTPAIPVAQAFVTEFGYTAFLGFVIMVVATDKTSPPAVAPFAIGATVFAGALVTGPLTGGSFNPARTLGPAIAAGVWTAHWLYWVAPIAGAIAGMWMYDMLRGRPAEASRTTGERRSGRQW
jgi:MIP family channel proteins